MDLHVFPIPIPPPYRPFLTPGPLTSFPPEPPPQSPSYACFPPVFAHFVASAGCTVPASFPRQFLFPAGGCSQAFFGIHRPTSLRGEDSQNYSAHRFTPRNSNGCHQLGQNEDAREGAGPEPSSERVPSGPPSTACFCLVLKR